MIVKKGNFLLRKKKYEPSIWVFMCKVTGFEHERAVAKVIKKDTGYSTHKKVYLTDSNIKKYFHIISKEKAIALIV